MNAARRLVSSVACTLAVWTLVALALTACGGGGDEPPLADTAACTGHATAVPGRDGIPVPPCREAAR